MRDHVLIHPSQAEASTHAGSRRHTQSKALMVAMQERMMAKACAGGWGRNATTAAAVCKPVLKTSQQLDGNSAAQAAALGARSSRRLGISAPA